MTKTPNVVIPNEIFDRIGILRDVFTKFEFENMLFVLFGILFSERKTIKGMAEFFGEVNQSTLNRLLTVSKWHPKNILNTFNKNLAEQIKDKKLLLIIDDTKIEKTGKKIEKVGWETDHAKKRNILCYSIVFSLIKVEGVKLSFPFAIEACKKKRRKKDKRKKSKITIAMKMIANFIKISQSAAKRIIVFDSWYCAEKLIKTVPKDIGWITRLKLTDDRLFWRNGCWLHFWKYYESVNPWQFKKIKVNGRYLWIHLSKVTFNGLGETTTMICKFSRYAKDYAVFISNLEDATEILENYEERWDIEVFFRSIKQSLGIGEVQLRSYWGNRRYWTLVLIAYSLISALQIGWNAICSTAGKTISYLRSCLENAAVNYGKSFGKYLCFYFREKFAKV